MAEQDGIRALLARIDERTQQTAEDVDKLKHVLLEGNGTPAVIVQVATHAERLKTLEEDRRDAKIPRHVSVGLVVSIILAGLAILAGFVK